MQQELTLIKNQLHAEQTKAITASASIKRMKARTKLIEKQIAEVEKEIISLVKQDVTIREKIDKVCTIPGVGLPNSSYSNSRNQRL